MGEILKNVSSSLFARAPIHNHRVIDTTLMICPEMLFRASRLDLGTMDNSRRRFNRFFGTAAEELRLAAQTRRRGGGYDL